MERNSEDLKKEGCREVITNRRSLGLKIKRFVTDEYNKISKLDREQVEDIIHVFMCGSLSINLCGTTKAF